MIIWASSNQYNKLSWSGSESNVSLFDLSAIISCIFPLSGHIFCRLEKETLPSYGLSIHNNPLCPAGIDVERCLKKASAFCSVITSSLDKDNHTATLPREAHCTAVCSIRLVFPNPPFPAIMTGWQPSAKSFNFWTAFSWGISCFALITLNIVGNLLSTI